MTVANAISVTSPAPQTVAPQATVRDFSVSSAADDLSSTVTSTTHDTATENPQPTAVAEQSSSDATQQNAVYSALAKVSAPTIRGSNVNIVA